MATDAQKSDFISKSQQAATDLLDAVDRLNNLDKTRVATAITDTLPADLTGLGHPGLTAADVTALYTSLAAINNLLDGQFHRVNLERLRVG